MVLPLHSHTLTQSSSTANPPRADLSALGYHRDSTTPLLGRAAVTPVGSDHATRNDPWPKAPPDPAPIKGLGIPPLNTRQVGDFDRLDAPEPPVARYYDMLPAQGMGEQLDLKA